MARHRRRTVFGESAVLVGEAVDLLGAAPEDAEAGAPQLTEEQSGALVRALLRAEAHVLRRDADRLRQGHRLRRDPGDRPFVALLLVVQRLEELQRA